jgi:hypothetical protein
MAWGLTDVEVTHVTDAFDADAVTGGDDDESLVTELRALGALHDPVPPDAVLAARSAIAHLTIDAELAALVADTPVDPALAGVRAGRAPIMLSFQAEELTVEVEVLDEGPVRRIAGQLVPPTPGRVVVRHAGGTIEAVADEVGRFTAAGVSPGPVRLRCEVGGRSIATDWFLA